jgi:hypothetical protein
MFVLQLASITLAIWISAGAAQPRPQVDLLLVLAADVSNSVDQADFQLQRSGYAVAFSDSRVISAIQAGPMGRIAVAYVEWSGPWMQKLVIDWTLIDTETAAHQFSKRLMEEPRAYARNSTSISAALDYAAKQLAVAPYRASRRIIDISGDGENNTGRPVAAARDDAVADGITINGLVIVESGKTMQQPQASPIDIEHYYRTNVIGGGDAFVEVAREYRSFGAALIRKLIKEIAFESALEKSPNIIR